MAGILYSEGEPSMPISSNGPEKNVTIDMMIEINMRIRKPIVFPPCILSTKAHTAVENSLSCLQGRFTVRKTAFAQCFIDYTIFSKNTKPKNRISTRTMGILKQQRFTAKQRYVKLFLYEFLTDVRKRA